MVKDGKKIAAGLGIAAVVTTAIILATRPAKAAPAFEVTDLVIAPEVVQVGYPVTISCLVENISAETGDYRIKLRGDFMAEQIVTLVPGESRTISFEVVPEVAKVYSVSVDGLYGSFVATEVPVADIRVENLFISPTEVNVGEMVIISVTATNYGTATGEKIITCIVV